MLRVGINCGRLQSMAPLQRAQDLGLCRVLDVPGPHARACGFVREFLESSDVDASVRLMAKVGYCEAASAPATAKALDGHVSHALQDAAWVCREVATASEALGRAVDVALLHNPEEIDDGERRTEALLSGARAVLRRRPKEQAQPPLVRVPEASAHHVGDG